MTAAITPAKNALMQQNIRMSSTLVMVSPCDGGHDGGAKAALVQPFVGDGVRPVLRQKIKSNQIGASAFAIKKSPGKGRAGAQVDEGI